MQITPAWAFINILKGIIQNVDESFSNFFFYIIKKKCSLRGESVTSRDVTKAGLLTVKRNVLITALLFFFFSIHGHLFISFSTWHSEVKRERFTHSTLLIANKNSSRPIKQTRPSINSSNVYSCLKRSMAELIGADILPVAI